MSDAPEHDDPLAALREEVARKKEAERLSEVRGTRLTRKDARRVDYVAESLGLDVSDYIRLTLLGELSASEERPDVQFQRAVIKRMLNLVRQHEQDTQDSGCASRASELRTAFEKLASDLI